MTYRQLLVAAWHYDKGGLFAVLMVPVAMFIAAMIGEIAHA